VTVDSLAELSYLVLLGTAIVGYALVANRHALSKLLQFAMLWGFIFLGVVASVGLWDDLEKRVIPRQAVFASEGRIEVPRSADGHYYLTLNVGEVPVRFVVDTGATDIVLTRRDAERLGFELDTLGFIGAAKTANGRVRTARVHLKDLGVGELRDEAVAAWVNEGDMDTSLLGMAYLNRFDSIEIRDRKLILER
jgi:aspartyl protease family protein